MIKNPILRTTAALIRFHARVGSRVAIRALAPVLASAFGLFYLLKPELFVMLARRIFADADGVARGLVVAAALLAAASTARKAVFFGLCGWLRSLPVGGRAHRRAAVFAVTLAETPITFLLFASLFIGSRNLPRNYLVEAAGLLLASAAAAAAVVPAKNNLRRIVIGGTAAVLAGSGNPAYLGFSVPILLAVDYLSGPLHKAKTGTGRRNWMVPLRFPALISVRALGFSGWSGYLPAGVVVGLTALFLKNNVLTEPLREAAMRAGGALSIAVFLAFTAGFLVADRAPWPWSRSWPRSARRRIISDALFLGIPALALCVPLQWIGWPAVWGAASYLPAGAARAAGAVNAPRETRSKILGTLLLEGGLAAAAYGLWTNAGVAILFLTPLLIEVAAFREKTLKVTAWDEMHHDVAGDPGSWSSR
jgi:hypothetical protein